jgi:hypothetical protein
MAFELGSATEEILRNFLESLKVLFGEYACSVPILQVWALLLLSRIRQPNKGVYYLGITMRKRLP